MKIKHFDRSTCDALSKVIIAALKSAGIEDEYGVKLADKGGSFSDNNFTMRLEIARIHEDGGVLTKEAQDFKTYARRYGLTADCLNKVFVDLTDGTRWKVVGAKPRSPKYPILVEKVGSGMLYKFPANRVALAFAAMELS
jgi:hypothetical protein